MPLDPLDLETQDQLQAEARQRAQLNIQIEIEDLRWVMANPKGRRFVANMLAQAGIYRLSFKTDALLTAFSEGSRNIGLRLLDQITTHCNNQYIQMLKESNDGNK